MAEIGGLAQELPVPPPRLFERLAQIAGYTWDQSIEPFHSSYDNWHVFGIRHLVEDSTSNAASDPSELPMPGSTRSSPRPGARSSLGHDPPSSDTDSNVSSAQGGSDKWIPVIARVSTHSLRLEREFHVTKSIIQTSDPNCLHTVAQIELIRLPIEQGDRGPLVVSILESPGPDYLKELVNFGPAWYTGSRQSYVSRFSMSESNGSSPGDQIPLAMFLEFAIGASECVELLHHGQRIVHGELCADAFHFNQESGSVKLINFGSGLRSFENGLTSAGWSSLSKELGVKTKLQFIAPEQTGRMPAEPDSRTDIYSLGVLFWCMLTREPVFDGETPMDIVQSVLSRRIPPVSSKRMDIPDVLSEIIQKMTQKQIEKRYHSISGLKFDLIELQSILGNGDGEALKSFIVGTRDVSSFFVLPASLFGRQEQHDKIFKVIEKFSKTQRSTKFKTNGHALHIMSSHSSMSGSLDFAEGSSDTTSHGDEESRSNSATTPSNNPTIHALAPYLDQTSQESVHSFSTTNKPTLQTDDSRESIDTRASINTFDTDSTRPNGVLSHENDAMAPPAKRRGSQKFRRRGRCEVITISGAAGLGKSSLVLSVQPFIRKLG
ncbi:MAG: hypothetical protein M1830_007946 [Pleopsidium flavum]|nr:MAG: hypothetical protein M1830_007946 [Pleopsidium flavum]